MLKKALLGLLMLAVATASLILGACFVHGQYYLNQQQIQLRHWAHTVGLELQLLEQRFSWFSSDHRYRLSTNGSESQRSGAKEPVWSVEFVNHADYFPYRVVIRSSLLAPPAWQEQLLGDRLPIEALTEINLFGEVHGELAMDPWQVDDAALGGLQCYSALARYEGTLSGLSMDLNWDGFELNGLRGEARLQGLRLTADIDQSDPALYLGRSELSVSDFGAADDTVQLAVRDLRMSSELQAHAEGVAQALSLGWESVSVAQAANLYHSAQSHLKMRLSGLHHDSWQALQSASQSAEVTAAEAEQHLLALLQNGMGVDVDGLKLNLQDANMVAALHIQLAPNQLPTLSQLATLQQQVNGDGQLVIDSRLVQLLPVSEQALQQLVALGYLSFDANTEQYKAEALLEQGVLKLNGQLFTALGNK